MMERNFPMAVRTILLASLTVAALTGCRESETDYERVLPMQGAANLRDLGGYETADGRHVKWRTVLRGDDLHALTDADLETLAQIPLRSAIDFRDSVEVAAAPDRLPATVEHRYWLPIATGSLANIDSLTAENSPMLLVSANRSFVRDWQGVYTEFFRLLQQEGNAPLVFHCTAGKDRTGYGALLFLLSLGVERQTAIDDYMLSAETLREKYAPLVAAHPEMAPLMTVRREYIEAALDEIDRSYGGVERYLTANLGVDLERMRELYTE